MTYRIDKVDTFDKGIIDELGDENIPASASSSSKNFFDLGDRIELVRGTRRLGDDNIGADKVLGVAKVIDTEGNEIAYKQIEDKLQRLDGETWVDVQTSDLVENEELAFTTYRSPAGSFLWYSSKNTGLFRINAANPDDYYDFYPDMGANQHRGKIITNTNRMWMWDILNNETLLRLSYIDNDWPYDNVTNEVVDTGDGSTKTFNGTLAQDFIAGNAILITDDTEDFTDDSNGTLIGDQGGSGTINYTTGEYSVTFNTAPSNSQDIKASYDYEDPTDEGIADFSFSSPTRAPGEGLFFRQFVGDDPIQYVANYDGIDYIFHENSVWLVDLTDDDTNAINKPYRKKTGIPNWRATVPDGDGIYYIDDTDENDKQLKILKYDDLSTQVEPKDESEQINLDNYRFDKAAGIKFGNLIIFACKSNPDVNHNDIMLVYNTKWGAYYRMEGAFSSFMILNGALYGGSSVNGNVYKIFDGPTFDGAQIEGVWESNDYNLGTEELKRFRRFVVEGDMDRAQRLRIEASYDGGPFTTIGEIDGDSEYVNTGVTSGYGVGGYGTSPYGGGEDVSFGRYYRRFKLKSPKFYRVKLRFSALGAGYLNVRMRRFDDIRIMRTRSIPKFRA